MLLVVPFSDLQTGAVDMDPDIVSKICSSLNLDPLLSPLISDQSLDDLVDGLTLVQNNNWEMIDIYKPTMRII